MITILANLEVGYESSFEHLAFRQLKGTYQCKLVCVPHDFPTFQEALDSVKGTKIFMVPPDRVKHSTEFEHFSRYSVPGDNVVFCFGSPQETMVPYIEDEIALHITTPGSADMMAVCVAGIVLYVHG